MIENIDKELPSEKIEDIDKVKKQKNSLKREIIEWVVCFVIAYTIYLIINYFFGTISGVKQTSMYPTAKEGEKVIISRRVISPKPLERGQIITFEAPCEDYIVTEETSNTAYYTKRTGVSKVIYDVFGIGKKSYIKRIIGIAGDKIFISEDGKVFLNDKELNEKYLNGVKTFRTGLNFNITVPKDYVFVMGDNRSQSKDSRYFGAVPISKVEGTVITRVWPLNRLGSLDK